MNVFRYLIMGIDPKKTSFAACTYTDIRPASAAAYQFKKLGVTPVLIDLSFIDERLESPTALLIQPHSQRGSTSPPPVQPLRISPTNPSITHIMPRYFILELHPSLTFDYSLVTSLGAAETTALALAKRKYACGIIDVTTGTYVQQYLPGGEMLSPNTNVTRMPLPQFVIGKYNGKYSNGLDSVLGLDGQCWDILFETDELQTAYAQVQALGMSEVYDRDNDYKIISPAIRMSPSSMPAPLLTDTQYLKIERWALENEMRFGLPFGLLPSPKGSPGLDTSVHGLILALQAFKGNLPRRSGQSAANRAKDWSWADKTKTT